MKKVLFGLVLFIIISIPSKVLSENKKFFCSSDANENNVFVIQEEDILKNFSGDRCKEWQKKYYTPPYPFEVNEILEEEFNNKNTNTAKNIELWNKDSIKKKRLEESGTIQISKKTDDYIILEIQTLDKLSFKKDVTDVLQKYSDNAAQYCGNLDKTAFLFYRQEFEDDNTNLKVKNFIFDQDFGLVNDRIRFFCSKDFTSANNLINRINIEEWSNFKSFAGSKKYEHLKLYYSSYQTEQLRNKEKEAYEKDLLRRVEKRLENERLIEKSKDKVQKEKITELEKSYGKKCSGNIFSKNYEKGTKEYNNCLMEEEAKVLAAEKKKADNLAAIEERRQKNLIEEKNKKLLAEEKKQKAIDDKKNAENLKAKEFNDKLAKMSPDDRRAYTCTEKFGFRKGSDKFKDCVFELYKAENELEKIQLQKQVAQANLEAAKAKESAARSAEDQRLALMQRQTRAQEMQGLAALQQAREAEFSNSMALINQGLSMMSPQRPAVAPMRTCTFNGRFMNCF